MKLKTDEYVLDKENPYANDLFGRKMYGECLKNLVSNIDESLVIAITGKWGTGKTTFSKMWMSDLLSEDKKCIYINAFDEDIINDSFTCINNALVKNLEEYDNNGESDSDIQTYIKKAKAMSVRLLPEITKLILSSYLKLDIDKIEEIIEGEVEGMYDHNNILRSYFTGRIDEYSKKKRDIIGFRDSLETITKSIRDTDGFPLTVIIDELDRCKPTFALEMIESLKHFFSVEGLTFVLVVNMDQLANSVKNVYGTNDGYEYLQKFIDIDINLPIVSLDSGKPIYEKYILNLMNHHSISNVTMRKSILCLSESNNITLRQLQKIFMKIAILNLMSDQIPRNNPVFVALIATLLVINKDLIDYMLNSDAQYKHVSDTLRINDAYIKHKYSDGRHLICRWIEYLCSNDQQALADSNDATFKTIHEHVNDYYLSSKEMVEKTILVMSAAKYTNN